ncbi:uncharacterized protein LOC8284129 [Ricinus communis]|uniref:Transmembrane protein n=1 Tax=Ricinus communis TaxID=3988 RepID=B9S3G6_RICCO|nr:uncharacterized protein LOC8284129 [Ricinus communis]EEF41948.1 conserved hypothetical protein [Ricinus communis]|eukprot:XP_002520535.1 uncharacterized protein LOC8284129 [Ricinus communis]
MAMTWISLHPHPLLSITKPRLPHSSLASHNLAAPSLSLSTPFTTKRATILFQRRTQIWRLYAAPEEALPSDTAALESAQKIAATSDDPTANIISLLLFIAFVVLAILTVGVIYLGVTDFLGKREKEKFEKEEAAKKKKKGGKKGKVRARTGPRGFGQKIKEEDDNDDS